MALPRETRAQIDTETVKRLLFMHGGGSVALLAFLPHVITDPELVALTRAILAAMFVYQLGLVTAIIHNRLRRKCSLEYSIAEAGSPPYQPAACGERWIAWASKGEPCVCCASIFCLWTSVVMFVVAGFAILAGGLSVVWH